MTGGGERELVREVYQMARDYVETAWITRSGWLTVFERELHRLPADEIEYQTFRDRKIHENRIKAQSICHLAQSLASVLNLSENTQAYFQKVMTLEPDEDTYKERKESAIIQKIADDDYNDRWGDYEHNF